MAYSTLYPTALPGAARTLIDKDEQTFLERPGDDTLLFSAVESPLSLIEEDTTDTVWLIFADASVVVRQLPFGADTMALIVADSASVSLSGAVAREADDSLVVTMSELAVAAVAFSASDALVLDVADEALIIEFGQTEKAGTDTLTARLAEGFLLEFIGPFRGIETGDVLPIGFADDRPVIRSADVDSIEITPRTYYTIEVTLV